MRIWSRTKEASSNFSKDRPTLDENNNSLYTLFCLLQGEVEEVYEEVVFADKQHKRTGEVSERRKELLANELADVVLFTMQMFELIGIDMLEAVLDKIAYNMTRYTAGALAGQSSAAVAIPALKQVADRDNLYDQFYSVDRDGNAK